MLDDHAGSDRVIGAETLHALPRRIRISDVVVRELFALQLGGCDERAGCRVQVSVERRALVWVLAIAQVLQLDEAWIRLRWVLATHWFTGGLQRERRQVVADGGVVARDAVEGSHRQREAGAFGHRTALLQFVQHPAVLRRVGQHRDVLPVLRCRSDHRRAADIDVLDRLVERAARLRHRRLEGVEVHHQQVDCVDAIGGQRGAMLGHVAAGQQATVDGRVKCLDPPIEHLRKAGVVGHLGHWQARLAQQSGGAACRQQLPADLVQPASEFDHARLVGDRDQCMHVTSPACARRACGAACCG